MPNQQLAEESQQPIITTFEKRKVYSLFKVNIWGTNLVIFQRNNPCMFTINMQLISKYS